MDKRIRNLHAGFRDTFLLLNEFRQPLFFFIVAILGIGTYYFYAAQSVGEPLESLPEAYYMILGLAFFQSSGVFPQHGLLQIWFFILPIIGIGTLAQGLADFGMALFNRRTRNKEWEMAVASTFNEHTILVGLGHLGYRVVSQMSAMGESVVVIELDPKTDLVSTVQKMGVPIIQDDAQFQSTLESAGIKKAKTIVLCTQNDSLNLQVALKARTLNTNVKVVMRIFDDDFAKSLDSQFGFKAISTTGMAAPAFAFAATGTDITRPITVEGESLSLAKFCINRSSILVGLSVADVEHNYDVSIVLLKREFEPDLHPIGDRVLEFEDTLAILGNPVALQKIIHENN
ncbi:MAG: NAD-binding protein [Chloroflexota bacterium]